jgi:hypothetical protein
VLVGLSLVAVNVFYFSHPSMTVNRLAARLEGAL